MTVSLFLSFVLFCYCLISLHFFSFFHSRGGGSTPYKTHSVLDPLMDSTNLWTITMIAESTLILCLYNRRLKIIQNLIWTNDNRQSPFKPSPYIRLKCQSLFSSQVTAKTCISSYPRTKLPRGRLTTLKVLHFSQAQVNILAEHNLIYFDYRMHCKIVFNFALRHDLSLLQDNSLLA